MNALFPGKAGQPLVAIVVAFYEAYFGWCDMLDFFRLTRIFHNYNLEIYLSINLFMNFGMVIALPRYQVLGVLCFVYFRTH